MRASKEGWSRSEIAGDPLRRPLRKRLRLRFRVPHAHARARRENRPDLGPRTIVTANIVIIHRNPPAVLAPADARFSQQRQSSLPPPVSSRSHGDGHVNANACTSHRARASRRKYSGFWYRYPDFIFIPSDLHFVRPTDRTRSISRSLSSPHDSSTLTKFPVQRSVCSNRIARSEVWLCLCVSRFQWRYDLRNDWRDTDEYDASFRAIYIYIYVYNRIKQIEIWSPIQLDFSSDLFRIDDTIINSSRINQTIVKSFTRHVIETKKTLVLKTIAAFSWRPIKQRRIMTLLIACTRISFSNISIIERHWSAIAVTIRARQALTCRMQIGNARDARMQRQRSINARAREREREGERIGVAGRVVVVATRDSASREAHVHSLDLLVDQPRGGDERTGEDEDGGRRTKGRERERQVDTTRQRPPTSYDARPADIHAGWCTFVPPLYFGSKNAATRFVVTRALRGSSFPRFTRSFSLLPCRARAPSRRVSRFSPLSFSLLISTSSAPSWCLCLPICQDSSPFCSRSSLLLILSLSPPLLILDRTSLLRCAGVAYRTSDHLPGCRWPIVRAPRVRSNGICAIYYPIRVAQMREITISDVIDVQLHVDLARAPNDSSRSRLRRLDQAGLSRGIMHRKLKDESLGIISFANYPLIFLEHIFIAFAFAFYRDDKDVRECLAFYQNRRKMFPSNLYTHFDNCALLSSKSIVPKS